jgi:hypothetical protein
MGAVLDHLLDFEKLPVDSLQGIPYPRPEILVPYKLPYIFQ